MRIARYNFRNEIGYGALKDDYLISLPSLARHFNKLIPDRLEDFITDIEAQEAVATILLNLKSSSPSISSIPLNEAKILAPIALPPKIVCLGLNYASHVAETKEQKPKIPVLFMKPRTAITGPNSKIIKRPYVHQLDYEGELAIVIGKRAQNVPLSEALDYIFGFTIFNDVSARDFQFLGSQWTSGKGFDTFAPTGPLIVTRDQLPNTNNLSIKTWVNGKLRQDGNTKDMIFSIPEIIHNLSKVMTLEPCDLIATGTPSGVGMAMKPPIWLEDGDEVSIEIEGIGILRNTVEEV
jgi:2-keto-4-pentenoate hydratase/2-oxohepta-3-ene-1,7-dioic acid hydratase in catechol pathway